MSNVKFVHQFVEGATIAFSAGEDASHPASNLLDRNPLHYAKAAAGTAGQTWEFDFPVQKYADTLIIDYHNFKSINPTVGIILQAWSGAAWVNIATINPPLDTFPYEFEFAQNNSTKWRLYFNSADPLSAIPYCGNIALGLRSEFTIPPDTARDEDNEYQTVQARALDSTPYRTQNYGGVLSWKLSWTNGSDSQVLTPFDAAWSSTKGDLLAFYFLDDDASIQLVLFRKGTNPRTTKAYLLYDILDVELEAFLAA